ACLCSGGPVCQRATYKHKCSSKPACCSSHGDPPWPKLSNDSRSRAGPVCRRPIQPGSHSAPGACNALLAGIDPHRATRRQETRETPRKAKSRRGSALTRTSRAYHRASRAAPGRCNALLADSPLVGAKLVEIQLARLQWTPHLFETVHTRVLAKIRATFEVIPDVAHCGPRVPNIPKPAPKGPRHCRSSGGSRRADFHEKRVSALPWAKKDAIRGSNVPIG